MSEKPRRGRPITKTEPDHTVLSRIPLSLWHKVEAYAKLHKQSISELVRDGLEMRLEYNPRALRAPESTADNNGAVSAGIVRRLAEQLTDLSTILAAGADTLRENIELECNTEYEKSVPDGRNATLPENDSVLQVLQEIPSGLSSGGENDTPSVEENKNAEEDCSITENDITVIQNKDDEDITPTTADIQETQDFDHAQQQHEALPTMANTSPAALLTPDRAFGYDTSKHRPGKLCPRGHDWQNTGQSLRKRSNGACLECDAESARARRQAKQPSTGTRKR